MLVVRGGATSGKFAIFGAMSNPSPSLMSGREARGCAGIEDDSYVESVGLIQFSEASFAPATKILMSRSLWTRYRGNSGQNTRFGAEKMIIPECDVI
jgi:hypothetical protein